MSALEGLKIHSFLHSFVTSRKRPDNLEFIFLLKVSSVNQTRTSNVEDDAFTIYSILQLYPHIIPKGIRASK